MSNDQDPTYGVRIDTVTSDLPAEEVVGWYNSVLAEVQATEARDATLRALAERVDDAEKVEIAELLEAGKYRRDGKYEVLNSFAAFVLSREVR